ncbi:MAG TPA: hypothetical protein V6C78_22575 [Crinalium sp.]
MTSRHRRAIGIFPNRQITEQALHELRDFNVPMDRVSVITREKVHQENIAGAEVHDGVHPDRTASKIDNKAEDGAAIGAVAGGALGGLTGLLVGIGSLAIPGIAPIMLAGATATALATTLAGTAIGAATGGLLGSLVGLGIPEERARVYHDRIARGEYLVIVDGTDEEIARAEQILHRRGIEDYGIYDVPVSTASSVTPPLPVAKTTGAIPVVSTPPVTPGIAPQVSRSKYLVGVFSTPYEAEDAIASLHNANFPLSQVSFIARDLEHWRPYAGLDLRDRFDAGRVGIPIDQARLYKEQLDQGHYLMMVNGTEDEIRYAAGVLSHHNIRDWQMYDPTLIESTRPVDEVVEGNPFSLSENAPLFATPAVNGVSNKQAVGLFANSHDAARAIADLRQAGFPASHIAAVSQQLDRPEAFAGITRRDRFDETQFGIPDTHHHFYRDRVNQGSTVVVVRGSDNDLHDVASRLVRHGVKTWQVYEFMNDRFMPIGIDHRSGAIPAPSARSEVAPVLEPDIVHRTTPSPVVQSMVSPSVSPSAVEPNVAHQVAEPSKRGIGVLTDRHAAEQALTHLRNSGFPMEHISVMGKDMNSNDAIAGVPVNQHTGNKADEGAKVGAATGAATGAALGGLGGLLVGLGTLAIPGIGPVILGGALATALATTLSGGAIGAAAGGILGALVGLGIPEDRAKIYSEHLNRGHYLVMVDGSPTEVHHAETMLKRHHVHEWEIFDIRDDDPRMSSRARQDVHLQSTDLRSDRTRPNTVERPVERTTERRVKPTAEQNVEQNVEHIQQSGSVEPNVVIIDRRREPH